MVATGDFSEFFTFLIRLRLGTWISLFTNKFESRDDKRLRIRK